MNKKTLTIIAIIMLMPMWIFGQDYRSLWKQVKDAEDKDLPQTAITHLTSIEKKARKEGVYGQLLKASLYRAQMQANVAPDSLKPAVERLVQEAKQEKNVALRAVYATVLYRVYMENQSLVDDADEKEKICEEYRTIALSSPDALGKVKNAIYEPFVEKENDSYIYGDDLLHLIGMEFGAWQWMHDYYEKAGNRRAACLTALAILEEQKGDDVEKLHESKYIRQLDSLINKYGDLDEAGEVALERYAYMRDNTTATAAEEIAYLDQAIAKWGNWKRISQLKNNRKNLITSKFYANIPYRVQMTNQEQPIKLTGLRHLSSLTMRVYRTKLQGDHEMNIGYKKDLDKVMADAVEVKEAFQKRTFSPYEEYEVFEDSIPLVGLPNGIYLLEFSTEPKTAVSRVLYNVTNLRVLATGRQESDMRYVVVDAITGLPINGAKVKIKSSRYNDKENQKILTTNAAGEANHVFTNGTWHSIYVYTDNDKACPSINSGDNFSFNDNNDRREFTKIYTDRAIYRPGQQVHVAAIIYARENYIEHSVVADKKVLAQLRDANYKVVAEEKLVTDEFGKCSTTFTLPNGLRNGRFTIRLNGETESIRVEEYKRPTFELSFS